TIYVEQHDHAFLQRHQSAYVAARATGAELRSGPHLRLVHVHHVRDPIDDEVAAARAGEYRQHDDDGHGGELSALEIEAHAQIDDRYDRAAQVQHTEHVRRRLRQLRDRREAADLLHPQDVHAIGLRAEHEGQYLARLRLKARLLSHGRGHRSSPHAAREAASRSDVTRMSPGKSRMSATEPSPRIVAPETPWTCP